MVSSPVRASPNLGRKCRGERQNRKTPLAGVSASATILPLELEVVTSIHSPLDLVSDELISELCSARWDGIRRCLGGVEP